MTDAAPALVHPWFAPTYYLLALVLAAFVIFNANAAALDYGAFYEQLGAGDRADTQVKKALEALSFGLYRGANEEQAQMTRLLALADVHERRATSGAWLLFGLSVMFLSVHVLTRRVAVAEWRSRTFVLHLLGVANVFLLVGLLAPILSLVAYTDVMVLGQVVFKYESKGIVTTLVELISRDNVFIAVTLLTFSVVTPVAKHVMTFLALRSSEAEKRRRYVGLLGAIGKWSMADVLVVAILLAFFVASADQFSDSWLGVGLYFFVGYCVMSLLAVHLVARMGDAVEVRAA
ncbi:MAG: hypothetical protein CMO26_18505 [Thiotrichales bacterium]|nr:hypothetical protein [Thiotrichales bacterium]